MTQLMKDRVCVVTGGNRGIGAAICSAFAAEGARIAILDLDPGLGRQAEESLRAAGAEARFFQVDVKDESAVQTAADRVRDAFGRVDVLVNNAGISRLGPSMSFPLADWQACLDVLATGVFLCSREFGKVMRGSGGAIVNISSLNGLVAFPMRLAYSAAKAAVISMTKVLAVEWAGYGIRVNAVAPGMIETDMLRQVIDAGLIDVAAYMAHTPLKRFGRPEEIAQAVVYLSCERSSYVTGQVLVPDGGWTAFNWIPWSGDPEAPEIGRSSQSRGGG